LIQEGVDFQAGIEATVPHLPLEPSDLTRVYAEKSIRLFGVPVFENPRLEIYGQPDAIDTAQGAMLPVEVKSHKSIQRSDELELAFYWLLLEPHRTKTVSPRGYLLLRHDRAIEEVEVEIPPQRFEQVHGLLQGIRDARDRGVRPRICSCTVCSGPMREEILRTTRANKDLTMIWDVGPVRARHLEAIGINSYEELLGVHSAIIVKKLRERRCPVSLAQVDRWKHHATSYSASRPLLFGDPPALGTSFIALDLEYGPNSLIWLVGVCLVLLGRPQYFSFWADTSKQEEESLMSLLELVGSNPSLPVVTWSGAGADMPQLRDAAQRLNLRQPLDTVESRHLDLFQHTKRAVRFPIPQLALGELATYFAIPKVSGIRDGLEAQSLYQEYRRCEDEGRCVALRTKLIEYNRDDLEALVGVAERIARLSSDSHKSDKLQD